MAESKRQSSGGGAGGAGNSKPKNAWGSGSQPAPPASASSSGPTAAELAKAIGAKIRITTTLSNHDLEGTIFAADATLDLLAIRDANSPSHASATANGTSTPNGSSVPAPGTYHVIPVSQIASFKIISLATVNGETKNAPFEPLGRIDLPALKAREDKAVEDAKKQEASRGKGVSKEGQELFDYIARTLPARWTGQTIIANDSVLIEPPYAVDNLRAPPEKQGALPHMRRVVGSFWDKRGGPSTTATASASMSNKSAQQQQQQQQHSRSQSSTPTPGGGAPARAPVPAVPLKKGG